MKAGTSARLGHVVRALKAEQDEGHAVVTSRCGECGWAGATLDEARRHARETPHSNFRTTTTVVSAAGRVLGERVEVHQI